MRIALCSLMIACVIGYSIADGLRAVPPNESPAIDLKVVKYDELQEAVRAQKGHILVVDVWADWCPPCKRMLRELVKMQMKYAKDGVVVMTVSLDTADQKDAALKFLRAEKVTGPNYLLDEKAATWQTKWAFKGPPLAFVFDREGKRFKKFDSDAGDDKPTYTHEDVEKAVKELVEAKP